MNTKLNHSLDAIIAGAVQEAKAAEQLQVAFDRAVAMVGASSIARSLIEERINA
jgi:hypothetical protein